MTRTVKEYDERYTEFLDVAQRLFYSQGYEPTSVQTIIATVGVAKGTFYHYFDSKVALLDALVARMFGETIATLEPVVADPEMDAFTKFETVFHRTNRWKIANKAFLLELLGVLYRDENVLLRNKLYKQSVARVTPLFGRVIAQGVAEGVFAVTHPYDCAEIIIALIQSLADSFASLLLKGAAESVDMDAIERKITTYERSIERVLGAAPDTLHLIDRQIIRAWFSDIEPPAPNGLR